MQIYCLIQCYYAQLVERSSKSHFYFMFYQQPNFIKNIAKLNLFFSRNPSEQLVALQAEFDVAECNLLVWQQQMAEHGLDISKMRQKRAAEFVAGRYLAWLALQQLTGHTQAVLPIGEDRAPIWPKGVVGSISHSNGRVVVVVVVKPASEQSFVGIDTEQILSNDKAQTLYKEFINPDELTLLNSSGDFCANDFALLVSVVFSAKEAIYKAYYPLVREFFSFDAVELTSIDKGRLEFKLTEMFPLAGRKILAYQPIIVSWMQQQDMVFSWIMEG